MHIGRGGCRHLNMLGPQFTGKQRSFIAMTYNLHSDYTLKPSTKHHLICSFLDSAHLAETHSDSSFQNIRIFHNSRALQAQPEIYYFLLSIASLSEIEHMLRYTHGGTDLRRLANSLNRQRHGVTGRHETVHCTWHRTYLSSLPTSNITCNIHSMSHPHQLCVLAFRHPTHPPLTNSP